MDKKKLIIFTDSGDTIVDEGSEYRAPGSEVVEHAQLIPGAKEVLQSLYEAGYQIQMVADGLAESFDHVYRQHGLEHVFAGRTISEVVGKEKPDAAMFQDAMEQLGLSSKDKARIIMVGNNLKRDILGANQYGIRSVLMSWSPRYCMTPEVKEEEPCYVVSDPTELLELAERLNDMLERENS